MNILFMCVANSARSQLAEGLAKKILGSTFHIESAGSSPTSVHPLARQVLSEVGIDISSQRSKSFDELDSLFIKNLDLVITLCAEEVCPFIDAKAQKRHWPLPDPAQPGLVDPLQSFRQTRDKLTELLHDLKLK